jgi:hypothetical protein
MFYPLDVNQEGKVLKLPFESQELDAQNDAT